MSLSILASLAPKLAAGLVLAMHTAGDLADVVKPEPPPVVTSEYYLLARPLPDTFTREEQQQSMVAVVVLRKIAGAHETLYERNVTFREGGLRVHHTETVRGDARCLVWRELLPTSSRTWMAQWGSGNAHTTAYGWNRPVHEDLAPAPSGRRDLIGPLELFDQVRLGHLEAREAVAVIDPSAAVAVDASVTLGPIDAAAAEATPGSAMRLEVRRTDGTILIDGIQPASLEGSPPLLEGARWTEGKARLRPIDAAEYERHRRRWSVSSRRPYEAMLERIPTRR